MPGAFDVLIAGGGPAGATAAALLARDGHRVLLADSCATSQHKVCGEFLSCEALRYLRAEGLDPWRLGATPLRRFRFAAQETIAEVELPFEAAALSRRSLDAALLNHARESGAHILTGRRVEELSRNRDSWCVILDDGMKMLGAHAILASGKHDLRDHARGKGQQPGLVAFKLHMKLAPEQARLLRECVEVVLFPGGYLGIQPAEQNLANVCLLIESRRLRALGGGWLGVLKHLESSSRFLRERLNGAEPCFARPLALSGIPYGFIRKASKPDLWPVGDQAAVIPSFTGDGISIALCTARLAARCISAGVSSDVYVKSVHRGFRAQIGKAVLLSRTMIAMPVLAQVLQWCPSLLLEIATSTRIDEKLMISSCQDCSSIA